MSKFRMNENLKKNLKKSSNWNDKNIFSRLFLYYWFDDNFAKLFSGTYFRNFEMAKSIKFFLIGCVVYYRIVSLNEFFLYRNRMRRAQIWAAKTRIIRQVKNETPTPSRRRSNLPPKNWRLARIKLHQRRQPQSLRSRLHPNPRTPKLSLHPQPIPLLKLQSEKWKKSKEKWHLHHQHSAEKHTKRKDPVKAHRLYYRHLKQY